MSADLFGEERPLPDGWKWANLGDVCDVVNGTGFPIKYQGQTSLPFPFVKVSDMNSAEDGITITGATNTVDESIITAIGAKLSPPGTVIFPKVGGAVFTNKKRILGTASAFDNNVMGLVPNSVHFQWLFYYLQGLDLASLANVQALPSIKSSVVKRLRIPLPPLTEQKRIIAILNEQFMAIEHAKKAAKERKEAVLALREALSRTAFEDPETLSWPETAIGDICNISSKQVDPTHDEYCNLPYMNGENIESGTGRILYLKSSAELGMTSGKYLFKKGDVLYSKLRPYLRKATSVDFDGLCSADMYPLTPNPALVTQDFLCQLLLGPHFTQYADNESKRTRMPKLNREQLMRWKQRIPFIDRQRSIIDIFNQQRECVEKMEAICQATISETEDLPQLVIHRAFHGEIQ